MPNEDANYALVCQKIDTLKSQVVDLSGSLKEYTKINEDRVRQLEINCTLLQQSNENICKDIGDLEKDVKANNLLTKIFGAVSGFFALLATLVTLFHTLMKGLGP